MLLRIPGLGVKSAQQIITARRYSKLGEYQLKKIGVVMKKARYFMTCRELPIMTVNELRPENVRRLLTQNNKSKADERQLLLQFNEPDA
jgi:predicted DNA-binding helix-hairpin-helix protein